MTRTLILSGGFHHALSIRLHVEGSYLSRHQVRRARRALCGVYDCQCGSVWNATATLDGEPVSLRWADYSEGFNIFRRDSEGEWVLA